MGENKCEKAFFATHCHPCSTCGANPTKTFSYAPCKLVYKYYIFTLPFSPFPLPSSHPLPMSSALAMSSPISTLTSPNSLLEDPFYSDSHGGFTPWEIIEPLFDQLANPVLEADKDPNSNSDQNSPNSTSSGYDNSDRSYAASPSEPNRNSTSSGSVDLDQGPIESVLNERRLKRKISNRQSAKRSRLKKRQQVENLRDQVSQLSKEKQERMELLHLLTHHLKLLINENARFRSEVIALRLKLMEFNQILTSATPMRSIN